MELKVWVEGIQRIVCGVGDGTTCQDVVFALAHATGKTGRFTLVERWRNNERLLAPSEQPLKVLTKWGERSNDVQFILQWAPLESPSGSTPGTAGTRSTSKLGPGASSRSSPDDFLLQRRPQSQSQSQSPSNSNSGNGTPTNTNSAPPPNSRRPPFPSPFSNANVNGLSWPSSEKQNSDCTRNGKPKFTSTPTPGSGSSTPTIAPPPYREPPPAITKQSTGKELPPYREPPPPNLKSRGDSVPSPVSSLSSYPGSLGGSSLVNTGVSASVSTFSRDASANNSLGSVNGFRSALRDRDRDQQLTPASTSTTVPETDMASRKDPSTLTNGDSSSSPSPSLNGINAQPLQLQPTKLSNSNSTTPSPNNSMYRDLVRLINLQREKLTAQQAELTQYDAEIMYWESKAKEQQKQMDLIIKEITRLESVSTQHESQMLSLSHIEQENELLAEEAEQMRSELGALKSEFSQCEQDLEEYQARIRALTNEVQATQAQVAARDEERRQRETVTLAEIERLRKELEVARRDTDAVQDLSGNLEDEVASIESVLAEKKKQMEQLVDAMKEANLQSLAILPLPSATTAAAVAQHAHVTQEAHDISGGHDATHCRSGSTRRILGSPRQLENAAPTSKNPHGVWV